MTTQAHDSQPPHVPADATPDRLSRVLKGVFVVGYASHVIGGHLDVIPGGHRLGMVVYVLLFAVGALAWRAELADKGRQILAHKRRALMALVLGLLLVVVLETVGGLAAQWLSEVVPGGGDGLRNDSNIAAVVEIYPPWVIIAVLAVMGPIVEEMFFRQFLLLGVARLTRPWVGVVVSSLLFGALHMNSLGAAEWIGVIPHACYGLAMGILFLRTRHNLVFPATLHVLNNLSGLLPMV